MLNLYLPVSQHSDRFLPKFKKVAESFRNNTEIAFVLANANKHRPLANRYSLEGFPAVLFFSRQNQNTPQRYQSALNASEFTTFVKKKVGPLSTQLESLEGAKEFIAANPLVFLFFGDGSDPDFPVF